MVRFPASPISPSEFFEDFLPKAFTEAGAREELRDLDLVLGVRLEGEGGGEWRVHLCDGAVRVEAGSREASVFSVVQSVEDWRGALWEGRGGAIGRQAAAVFRPGAGAAGRAAELGAGAIPAEATTTVSVRAEDAAALERGELNLLEAFMGGRIQVAGDLTLLMQMQAIQMQAAEAARSRAAGSQTG